MVNLANRTARTVRTCNLCPDVETGASERNRRRTALVLLSVTTAVLIHLSIPGSSSACRMLVSNATVWKVSTQIRGEIVGNAIKADNNPEMAARSSAMAGTRVVSKFDAVPAPSVPLPVPSSFNSSHVCSRTSRLMWPLGNWANRLLKHELSVSMDDINDRTWCCSSSASYMYTSHPNLVLQLTHDRMMHVLKFTQHTAGYMRIAFLAYNPSLTQWECCVSDLQQKHNWQSMWLPDILKITDKCAGL